MRVSSVIRPHPASTAPSPRRGEGWGEGRLDVILIIILLVGLWLRWGLNGAWRLGPDEALYSTWARNIASGSDPWLAKTPGVDKPPLLVYAIAFSMNIYGYHEFASRFPSIIASTVSILLTYLLALRLYKRREIARLAALLMALSPFAILYAPTAFADPLMVMWLLLAAVLAADDHWAWAGVAAALAVLTKQEAPLLLPIVVILGVLSTDAGTDCTIARIRGAVMRWLSLLIVFTVAASAIEWLWEAQRPGQPSPFGLGLAHYGGIGLVAASDVLPRLVGWWDEALRYVFVSPLLDVLVIVGVPVMLWGAGYHARYCGAGSAQPTDEHKVRRYGLNVDRLLVAAIVYAVLARTLVSFQMWNRYMLMAAPLLCIALARIVDGGWEAVLRRAAAHTVSISLARPLLPLLLVAMLMAGPVSDARAGHIPVGSDHGVYWGIDETAQFVRENVPPGSVIYHHSLGWQLGYYLYGVHMDFWWYPSLDWLAQTAAGRAEHSQYVVVPSWESPDAMAATLAAHGLTLLPVHSAHRPDGSVSFETYRIAPESDSSSGDLSPCT